MNSSRHNSDAAARAATARARAGKTSEDALLACARALEAISSPVAAQRGEFASAGDTAPSSSVEDDTSVRGHADIGALLRAHHDPSLHTALSPHESIGQRLFDDLERVRVEALGANVWAGVRVNLAALRDGQKTPDASVPDAGRREAGRTDAGLDALIGAVVMAVRELLLTAADGNPGDDQHLRVLPTAMSDIAERAATVLRDHEAAFRSAMTDQAAFAAEVSALLARLGLRGCMEGSDGAAFPGELGAPDEGQPDDDAMDEACSSRDDDSDSDGLDADDRDEEEHLASADGASEEEVSAPLDDVQDEPPVAGVDPRPTAHRANSPYRVWTRDFDEIVGASDLADADILRERRAELDRHLERQGRLVRRLAMRLQRALLARQRREWQYDLDEGQLDTRRLPRLVTHPLVPLVFKGEVDSVVRDTTVTLLIDNSRSMIGRPIMIAAACADILARTLERCGVGVEVLGFTTVELHGGRSSTAWEAAGRPDSPGRLNDLRHIVYKSADTPYRSARRQLALMLERDILKQNIDGEALQWAASRLLKRPQSRRILIVISDGSPVDTGTLSNNPRDYLDRHLETVVADMERRGNIELAAIGIGHDVARFYAQAMSVFDARELGPALLSKLESLLRRDD